MTDRTHEPPEGTGADGAPAGRRTSGTSGTSEEEALARETLSFVREASPPDVTEGVMARIEALDPLPERVEPTASRPATAGVGAASKLARTMLAWLWRPRTVRVRPALAFAAAAFVALVLGVLEGGPMQPGSPDARDIVATPADGGTPTVYVRFELASEEAASVALAGSFTDWQPRYRLAETGPGRWTALVPLPPGVHDYAFVVDGDRWVPDPDAMQVADGFGGTNSRIALVDPEA